MMATPALTAPDRARVRAAIAAAEAKTSGEIFVVVAETADDYRFIPMLWATLAALIVPLPLIFLTLIPASLIYVVQLAVFVVLAVAFAHPAIAPNLVPAGVKHRRAHGLAVQQFLAHGLHLTEARTGVLIFMSLAEHHAEIIADASISAKVDNAVWDASMERLLAEIRAGRLTEGLVAAIESTGAVLTRYFPVRPGDRNELSNDMVLL